MFSGQSVHCQALNLDKKRVSRTLAAQPSSGIRILESTLKPSRANVILRSGELDWFLQVSADSRLVRVLLPFTFPSGLPLREIDRNLSVDTSKDCPEIETEDELCRPAKLFARILNFLSRA